MQIFHAPSAAYTRMLLAAVPRLGAPRERLPAAPRSADTIVAVSDLTVRFDIVGGVLSRPVRRVHAVEDISFDVRRGETLALVGESGCGKSTIGKALLNLIDWKGSIEVDGVATNGLGSAAMRPVRRSIQMIFQDPYASLDPRMTVGELVAEPLVVHGLASGSELGDRVAWLFRRVGMPADSVHRHPHEFSGGQRQRICIARALSLSPKIIVADESVSALDVSVQARVLELLEELQAELGLSYLFISHNMAVVDRISHRVAVMYLGRIVEMGTRAQVFEQPCSSLYPAPSRGGAHPRPGSPAGLLSDRRRRRAKPDPPGRPCFGTDHVDRHRRRPSGHVGSVTGSRAAACHAGQIMQPSR